MAFSWVKICLFLVSSLLISAGISFAQETPISISRGAITGQILDDSGMPLAGWSVRAGQWRYHYGEHEFHLISQVVTNRDGVFLIRGLEPGKYCVRADDPRNSSFAFVGPTKADQSTQRGRRQPRQMYVPTYYPGVPDVQRAAGIVVRSDSTVHGIDIRVLSESPSGVEVRAQIEAAGRDVDGIKTRSSSCVEIYGTVSLDGKALTNSQQNSVRAKVTVGLSEGESTIHAEIGSDGRFRIPCASPLGYLVEIEHPRGTYIRSIEYSGDDLADRRRLDLTSGKAAGAISVALSSGAASIHGTVPENSGSLRSVPVTLWSAGSGFHVTVMSNSEGAFEMENLPPGDYWIAGWDQLHGQPRGWGVQTVREFRKYFERRAAAVRIPRTAGLSRVPGVIPAIIPRDAIEEAANQLDLNAVMDNPVEAREIREAAKSPYLLAQYIQSRKGALDGDLMRRTLGVTSASPHSCLDHAGGCEAQIVQVDKPDMVVLLLKAKEVKRFDVYLRFVQKADGKWQCTGEHEAFYQNDFRKYELTRIGERPFLRIYADESQNGIAVQLITERWLARISHKTLVKDRQSWHN